MKIRRLHWRQQRDRNEWPTKGRWWRGDVPHAKMRVNYYVHEFVRNDGSKTFHWECGATGVIDVDKRGHPYDLKGAFAAAEEHYRDAVMSFFEEVVE